MLLILEGGAVAVLLERFVEVAELELIGCEEITSPKIHFAYSICNAKW